MKEFCKENFNASTQAQLEIPSRALVSENKSALKHNVKYFRRTPTGSMDPHTRDTAYFGEFRASSSFIVHDLLFCLQRLILDAIRERLMR